MKQALLNLMCNTGVFGLFRLINRGSAPILLYHRFSAGESSSTTSANNFKRHLDYLTSRYRVVPLSLIAQRVTDGKELPARAAAITIDDGYRDFYEIAFPILRDYEIPATLFVVTDFIDRKTWLWPDKLMFAATRSSADFLRVTVGGLTVKASLGDRASRLRVAAQINSVLKRISDDEKEAAIERIASSFGVQIPALPTEGFGPLTWEQIHELSSAGVEIGSHTVSHPILTCVSVERLRLELEQSRFRLEKELARTVDLFCYPNGDYDERVIREVKRAGYRCAVTTELRLAGRRDRPLALGRVPAQPDLPRMAQHLCGLEAIKSRLRSISDRPSGNTDYEDVQAT